MGNNPLADLLGLGSPMKLPVINGLNGLNNLQGHCTISAQAMQFQEQALMNQMVVQANMRYSVAYNDPRCLWGGGNGGAGGHVSCGSSGGGSGTYTMGVATYGGVALGGATNINIAPLPVVEEPVPETPARKVFTWN